MQRSRDFHISASRPRPARQWHGACLGLFVAVGIAACAPSPRAERVDSVALSRANALLTDLVRTELSLTPESVSRLGLERYGDPSWPRRLNDASQAGFERARLIRLEVLAQIAAQRQRLPQTHPIERDTEITTNAYRRLTDLQKIGHGRLSLSEAAPYAIDPFGGEWLSGPDLLINDHAIETLADADAYIDRLRALSGTVDDSRRRLIADARAGIVPPSALLVAVNDRLIALLANDAAAFDILPDILSGRMDGIPGLDRSLANERLSRARRETREVVIPAYQRLQTHIASMISGAPLHGGLWAQPRGNIAYAALLQWHGSDETDLDQLHESHLSQVADLSAALATLTAQAPSESEASEVRPRTTLLQTDTAPAVDLSALARPTRPAHAFSTQPLFGLRFVPASLNDRRPALFEVNPDLIARWTDAGIETLASYITAADLVVMSGEKNIAARRTPIRALIDHAAFELGWPAYRQARISLSADAPPNAHQQTVRLNLLQAALAAADTGMHHKRWSIDQTIAYLTETTGLPEPLMRQEALRIAAYPAAASARMIGLRRIEALSSRAEAILGPRFDRSAFDTVILTGGPRPLNMVERDVEAWYQGLMVKDRTLKD